MPKSKSEKRKKTKNLTVASTSRWLRRLTSDMMLIVLFAAVGILIARFSVQMFAAERLVHIVVSEFVTTSPAVTDNAEELHTSIYQYIEGMLNREAAYFDALIVKVDTVVNSREMARRIGEEQPGDQAIVLWGLLGEDSYTPNFTMVNPPRGFVSADNQQANLIHDVADLQGQALNLATSTLSVAGFSIGLVHYWSKKYQLAINFFERAFEQDDSNDALLFYIGNCYYYQKEYQLSEESFRKILSLEPEQVAALNNLAVANLAQGKQAEAIEILERGQILDPTSSAILVNLSVAHRKNEDNDLARIYLEKALQIDPENSIALTNRAVIASENGNKLYAIELLEKASQADDAPVATFVNLGQLYSNYLNNHQKALAAYHEAEKLAPQDSSVALGLVMVYLKAGDEDKALLKLGKFLENVQSPAIYYQRFGDIASDTGLLELAKSLYHSSFDSDPLMISNLPRMAEIDYRLGKSEAALQGISTYLKFQPEGEGLARALELGCVLAYNAGQYSRATDFCRRAYLNAPDVKVHLTNYVQSMLGAAGSDKDTSAIPAIESAMAKMDLSDSLRSRYLAEIGNVYLNLKDFEKGIHYYRQALQSDSANHIAQKNIFVATYNYALNRQNQRDWEKALSLFEEVSDMTSSKTDRALIIYNKASIYQQMGQRKKAESCIDEFLAYTSEHKLNDNAEIRRLLTSVRQVEVAVK